MKSIWNKIINLGIDPDIDVEEKKNLSLINYIFISLIAANAFYIGLFYMLNLGEYVTALYVSLFIFFITLYLLYLEKHTYAKILFISTFIFIISYFIFLFGLDTAIEYWYFVVIGLSTTLLFNKQNKLKFFFFLTTMSIYLYAMVIGLPEMHVQLNESINSALIISNMVFTLIFTYAILNLYNRNIKSKIDSLDNLVDEKTKEIVDTTLKNSQAKDEFLANMSHEIRTPMNAIVGLSNLLTKHKDLSEKQVKYINAISLNSKNLLGIISDVLDFSKIEAGKLELAKYPFNIKDSLTNLHYSLNESAKVKNLALKLNISQSFDYYFNGDWVRISQILTNLVSNAIKFTHEGEVSIDVVKLREDDEYIDLQFSVKDTGIGIAKENISEITKPFSQENTTTTRDFGGTGLGLSISLSLLDLYSSKLNIDSTPNEGSDFYFTLSFKKVKNETDELLSPQKSTRFEPLDNAEILIVDNDNFNTMVATDTISQINNTINTSSLTDASEVTEKLKNNKYNIIILAINMPNLDVYDTITEIRDGLNTNTPIVIISGGEDKAAIEKCLSMGANTFIPKPFDENQFSTTLMALSN